MSAIGAAIAYGIIAVLGGIMGYVQARSKVSLFAGSICGLLLILAGVVQLLGQDWGLLLAISVTALLGIVFIMRWSKTGKFMPAGLMTLFGILSLVLMLNQIVF